MNITITAGLAAPASAMNMACELTSGRTKIWGSFPRFTRSTLKRPVFWCATVAHQNCVSSPQISHRVWLTASTARRPLVAGMQHACATDRPILQEIGGGPLLLALLAHATGRFVLHIPRIPQLQTRIAASVMPQADAQSMQFSWVMSLHSISCGGEGQATSSTAPFSAVRAPLRPPYL